MKEPSLDEMIDALVNQMEDWELETLMEWAQEVRREMLEGVDEATVREEYENTFYLD